MSEARFPVRLVVIGALLFWASVLIGLAMIVIVPDREGWVVVLGVLARVVLAAFATGICLILQAILWRVVRTRMRNSQLLAAVLLLPSVLLSALWITGAWHDRKVFLHNARPKVRAERILHNAQLAGLPESATEIEVYTWSSPFSGEEYLRFAAEPNDIERFIRESPNLQDKEPERYSAQRMRLPAGKDPQKLWEYEQAGHEVYLPHSSTPDWYKQEVTGPARRYIIRPKRYQFDGEVLIDDEQHIVYVYLCFS